MTDPFRDDPPRPIYRQRRHPLISILMFICGLVLLLPGLCAILFAGALGGGGSGVAVLWIICLAIGAGGLALIIHAFR